MDDLETLINEAKSRFSAIESLDILEQEKALYIGKSGKIKQLLKSLGQRPADERKAYGQVINQAKDAIESALSERKKAIRQAKMAEQLAAEALDVSLPGRGYGFGTIHPISRSLERIEALFSRIGFSVVDGPEIETDFFNFTALNTPEEHPARSMHDTFYLLDQQGEVAPDVLLRTHTSPIQARYMQAHVEKHKHLPHMPEIRIIAPGRVYRVDSDATHSPMFHQVEGLWVGEDISFADLKYIVSDFLRHFFEQDDLQVRFRPSFFPFTEPSAEIDVAFSEGENKGKWLEIAGCGMVHPKVLEHAGIDPEKYIGFAFGFGPDRLTMLRYGINDLRLFYEGDIRFLRQFQ